MDELSFQVIILLIAFGFLAAFIDSVVGGGGLISLPALMFVVYHQLRQLQRIN